MYTMITYQKLPNITAVDRGPYASHVHVHVSYMFMYSSFLNDAHSLTKWWKMAVQ